MFSAIFFISHIADNVILTEVGYQKIYVWVPVTRKLELIANYGPGTINSIEFDEFTNNLYWLDSTTHRLKVMNLDTRLKVNLVNEEDPAYLLSDFTLISHQG